MQPEQIQLHSSSVRTHRVYLEELLRRSCQPWCCTESVSLAGSSFLCLFPSISWTLKNPADSRQVQNAASLPLWAKQLGRGGWKPKATQPFPRSCINLLNICQVKEHQLSSLIWEGLQNFPADFTSLRFVTSISWEVIKDTRSHLWWSRTFSFSFWIFHWKFSELHYALVGLWYMNSSFFDLNSTTPEVYFNLLLPMLSRLGSSCGCVASV